MTMNTSSPMPEGMSDTHLAFLDGLRESAAINMFGAAPFLMREFALDRDTASAYLFYWMETFGERHGAHKH